MSFVLDASVALAWLLRDEANERTDALAQRLEQENACVPQIWTLEVGNALLEALRRKRISGAELKRCVSAMSDLPIEVDTGGSLANVSSVAQQCGLTTYDAAYIELSQRRLPLATLDGKLRKACTTLEVPVVP